MGNSAVARCVATLGAGPVVYDGNGTATMLASQDLSAGRGMADSTQPQIPSVNAIGLQVDDGGGRDPLNPAPLPAFPNRGGGRPNARELPNPCWHNSSGRARRPSRPG